MKNGYDSSVIHAEYGHIDKIKNEYHGIVTDIPYGNASKTSESPDVLLQNFINKIPKKKKFAIMCKKGFEKELTLKPTKKYEIYRHKSLTRTILVK